MIAIVSLLLVITLSVLVTRIASIALTLTGLSRESARFQARSAFTGVGFTTEEAETVVSHPVRRKVILLLMLLGSAGIVTAVTSLLLSFVQPAASGTLLRVGVLGGGIVVLWLGAQSRFVDRQLSRIVTWALRKYTRLEVKDYARLMDLGRGYGVSECGVVADDWLSERSLRDLSLTEEGILVLGIRRKNGTYLGAPTGDVRIRAEDTLVLYGRSEKLQNLSARKKGPGGDRAHEESKEEEQIAAAEERVHEARNR
jgi:hypothetical protein